MSDYVFPDSSTKNALTMEQIIAHTTCRFCGKALPRLAVLVNLTGVSTMDYCRKCTRKALCESLRIPFEASQAARDGIGYKKDTEGDLPQKNTKKHERKRG